MTTTSKPKVPAKPLSEMTPSEREAYMRQKTKLREVAKCRECKREYLKHQGVSGYCPVCVATAMNTCC